MKFFYTILPVGKELRHLPRTKFGIYFTEVAEIKKVAAKYKLQVVGVHQHIGSGIRNPEQYLFAMDVLIKVAAQFDGLEFVNFGGGIGVNYKPDDSPINITEFGKKISDKFSQFCKKYGKDIMLYLEPGRYIVCESGFLIAQVNNRQSTPAHTFIGIDTGFNHLIRPTMYGSYHPIINASNAEGKVGKKEKVVIAGNICESGDVFTRDENGPVDRELPYCTVGDIIVITHAGAYGYVMASEYNSRPLPMEIMVSGGKSEVIRKKQSMDDVLRGTFLI